MGDLLWVRRLQGRCFTHLVPLRPDADCCIVLVYPLSLKLVHWVQAGCGGRLRGFVPVSEAASRPWSESREIRLPNSSGAVGPFGTELSFALLSIPVSSFCIVFHYSRSVALCVVSQAACHPSGVQNTTDNWCQNSLVEQPGPDGWQWEGVFKYPLLEDGRTPYFGGVDRKVTL